MKKIFTVVAFWLLSVSITACTGVESITINFETNGGNEIADMIVETTDSSFELPTPTKEGYTFDGWYVDEELTSPFAFAFLLSTTSLTVYAKWNSGTTVYTITFNTNGGTAVAAITSAPGATIIAPTQPTKTGFTFGGWYSDAVLTIAYTFTTMPSNNITLYAKWNAIVIQTTISFEVNGGSAVAQITQNVGSALIAPENPTRTGYTFGGWYSDDALTTAYTFTTMPVSNITLFAKWNAVVVQSTLTFEANGGSAVAAITQNSGTTVVAPTPPTRTGYTFGGWYSEVALTTAYTFTTMPSNTITLYAKWTINQYTISFEENGGTDLANLTQDYMSAVSIPTDPTKVGYTFGGWYSDINLTSTYTFTTMPSNNITLYAEWTINQYTISFEENGGTDLANLTQDYMSAVSIPTDPTKVGYTFGGWYSEVALTTAYTFTTMPSNNITLYAKWNIIEDNASDYTLLLKEDNTYEVIGYIGSNTELVIPSSYLGVSVTSIGQWTFYGNTSITSVIIPSTVTSIEDYAFFECVNLVSVIIPSSVTYIGYASFDTCTSLTDVTIPSSVTNIGLWAFANLMSTSSITVDANNMNFSSENGVLFDKMKTSLITYPVGKTETHYTIPSSVTYIEQYAFNGCYNLTSITIPANVTDIGVGAFYYMMNLNNITVDENNSNYSSDGGVLFDKLKTLLVRYPSGKTETHYTIPSSVIRIENHAFAHGEHLISITIPNTVISVGEGSFSVCFNLLSITIPSSLTDIGRMAFTRNHNLSNIFVDEGNNSYASENGVLLNKLKTALITYPAGKTEAHYVIPSGVITIITGAFAWNNNLTSLTIPTSVTNIQSGAFARIYNLENIFVDEMNGDYFSKNGVLFDKQKTVLITYPSGKTETEYTIPSSVTNIAKYAFSDCSYITEIMIPSSVINIEQSAFARCLNLTIYADNDEIPSGWDPNWNVSSVPVIWEYDVINEFTIDFDSNGGSEVASITEDARSTVLRPENPTKEGYAFDGWYSDINLISAYTFTTMPDEDITLYAKWIIIVIEDDVSNYTFVLLGNDTYEITDYLGSKTEIIIPSTYLGKAVTSIGYGAFWNCTELIQVILPDSIVYIGEGAFSECISLTNIIFGSGILYIAQSAFYNCSSLESITIPNSVLSIGYNAFNGCSSLTSMSVPFIGANRDATGEEAVFGYFFGTEYYEGGTETIQYYANGGLFEIYYIPTNLQYLIITDAMVIHDRTFYNCSNLVSITISSEVTSIGLMAFRGCSSMTSFIIPDTVTSIEQYAFYGCLNLLSISIPSGVTRIEIFTFANCHNLLNVTISEGVTYIDDLAFYLCPELLSIDVDENNLVYSSEEGVLFSKDKSVLTIYPGGKSNSEYTIPLSVSSFGKYAFFQCSNLMNLTVSINHLYLNSENGVIFNLDLTYILAYPAGKTEESYIIPETVSVIEQSAFNGNQYLTSITIPSGVVAIGQDAFWNCTGLLDINIPSSVTTIESWAFQNCLSLTSIFIPSSVELMGVDVFSQCENLIVYVEAESEPLEWSPEWNISGRTVIWGYSLESESTITFDSNEGSIVESITQEEGSTVLQPENPTKEGYVFDGWYSDINLTSDYTFTIMPVEDITLYAKWIDDPYQFISIEYGGIDNFTLLGVDGSVMGYDNYQGEVNTWYFWAEDSSILGTSGSVEVNLGELIITQESLGSVDFALQTMIITDIGLVQGSTYKIIFTLTSDTIRVIDVVTKAPNDNYLEDTHNLINVKVGTFEYEAIFTANQNVLHLNIMTGVIDSSVDAGTLEFSDFEIYVIPLSEYSITFEENGGSTVSDIVGAFGTVFDNQETTRDGYTFDGWYLDEELTNWFADEVTTIRAYHIVLYAKWQIEQYSLSYYVYEDYDPLTDIALNPGETILSVSLGYLHSSALTSTGRLFTWGYNNFGQLGDGTNMERHTPIEITSQFNLAEGETIICVSLTAEVHSSAVTSEGRLFTWGNNWYGQLGDGTFSVRFTPTDITNRFNLAEDEKIISVSIAGFYSTALTSAGRVFTWGHNDFGQLGDGTINDKNTPIEITSGFSLVEDERIISIHSGANHSLALTSNGRVFPWGRNDFGQLGDNTSIQRNSPIEITSQFNLAEDETIISVSLRGLYSSAISSSGRLFTWGDNTYGQLGDSTTVHRNTPTDITSQFNLAEGETLASLSLGYFHASVLISTGRLFTWGYNMYGQVGDGTVMNQHTPIEITSQFNLVEGETLVSVSLGRYHSSIFTSTGLLFIWGYNIYGQLGDGTTTDQNTPIESLYRYPSSIQTDIYDSGGSITEYVPAQEGYTFSGWYSDIQLTQEYIFATMPENDINLYGRWVPIE